MLIQDPNFRTNWTSLQITIWRSRRNLDFITDVDPFPKYEIVEDEREIRFFIQKNLEPFFSISPIKKAFHKYFSASIGPKLLCNYRSKTRKNSTGNSIFFQHFRSE
jgi:hypothetical protein